MKVTLFTSNNLRHKYLIKLISTYCDELLVVQESKSFIEKKDTNYQNSKIIEKYFAKVLEAQEKIFNKEFENNDGKNIKTLSVSEGELNKFSLSSLKDYLESDIYIVFGSSYIKGDLVDFLIRKKAVNIHAGVSPYYRGTDCNFWALYDDNAHLVVQQFIYYLKDWIVVQCCTMLCQIKKKILMNTQCPL